jgi:hypothetical protein
MKTNPEMDVLKHRIRELEGIIEKNDQKTSGMCPLMGVSGHLCNSDCAWYIKGRGCAVAIIARDTSGR